MMGEGLGGGDQSQFAHNHLMYTIQIPNTSCAPSDWVFFHVVTGTANGITPSQPSPIKGEGFEAAPCSMRGRQR
jgi:hypothetical protein